MYCMDGNNSLKRMRPLGGRKVGDNRAFTDSDYFLPKEYVDRFANEVGSKASRKDAQPTAPDGDDMMDLDPPTTEVPLSADSEDSARIPLGQPCVDDPESTVVDDVPIIGASDPGASESTSTATHALDRRSVPLPPDDALDRRSVPPPPDNALDPRLVPLPPDDAVAEGDPTDGNPQATTCTKNWKAAQSDDKKRSWDVFEETGVFASACRHGFILWIIDMVRSEEL